MRRALELARTGWGQTAPNPMVGAVVVRDGGGRGRRLSRTVRRSARRGGGAGGGRGARAGCHHVRHARTVHASRQDTAVRRRNHHRGCDPRGDRRPRSRSAVAAGGADRLRAAGIGVDIGHGATEARELNAAFFHRLRARRAPVRHAQARRVDRYRDRRRRPEHDHVGSPGRNRGARCTACGPATTRSPSAWARCWPTIRSSRCVTGTAPRVPLTRVVFDSTLRTPLESALVRTARETPVVLVARAPDPARARALEGAGVVVVASPGRSPKRCSPSPNGASGRCSWRVGPGWPAPSSRTPPSTG